MFVKLQSMVIIEAHYFCSVKPMGCVFSVFTGPECFTMYVQMCSTQEKHTAEMHLISSISSMNKSETWPGFLY